MKDHSLPAFPCEQGQNQDGTWNQTSETGMSLRDYFAGQALNGWLASFSSDADPEYVATAAPAIAQLMYEISDAMLLERDK